MRSLSIAATSFLLISAPARAAVEGSFSRTLNVSGPVNLEVTTGSGSIRVVTGTSGEVRIEGRIRAGWHAWDSSSAEDKVRRIEKDPPIEQTGGSIRIGWLREEDLRKNVSISYEIYAPRTTELRARTGSGSVVVEDVEGPVDASTGSGSVRVSGVDKAVDASTGSGSIAVTDVAGGLKTRTGSGSIRADGVKEGLTASTGSGSIELHDVTGAIAIDTGSGSVSADAVRGSFSAQTGSGSISVDGEQSGAWRLRSSSGGITVRLPTGSAFDLECRTSSGSLRTDFPVTIQGTVRRKELSGRVHGGGPLLQASTSSGSIRILSRTSS